MPRAQGAHPHVRLEQAQRASEPQGGPRPSSSASNHGGNAAAVHHEPGLPRLVRAASAGCVRASDHALGPSGAQWASDGAASRRRRCRRLTVVYVLGKIRDVLDIPTRLYRAKVAPKASRGAAQRYLIVQCIHTGVEPQLPEKPAAGSRAGLLQPLPGLRRHAWGRGQRGSFHGVRREEGRLT